MIFSVNKLLKMKNTFRCFFLPTLSLLLVMMSSISCESREPSTLKIYVRDENYDLVPDAQVVIIGDTKSNPPTIDYVDTTLADGLGIATFDLEEFFNKSGNAVSSGNFDIIVKYYTKKGEGKVRVKEHIANVQTVYFQP